MANEDDIIQRISLLGADDIRKELQALGDDGADALKRIEQAGGGDLAKGVRQLIPEVAKFEKSMGNAVDTTAKLPGLFTRIGLAFKQLQGLSFGKTFQQDVVAAEAAGANFAQTLRNLGKEVRTLGRAIDIPGISRLGRSFSLVSRNVALIAFPAIVAGLGAVANSAASATAQVSDLAASLQVTPQVFARAASVVIAMGGSFEDAGKTFGTFEKNARDAAASANTAAEAILNARDALEGARDSASDAVRPFEQIRKEQQAAALSAAAGKTSLDQYGASINKLRDDWDQASRSFIKAEDAVDKAQKALDKARAATTPLEDAFRKVGVTVTDSFLKLPIEEQLKRVAPGFQALGKDIDRVKVAVTLFGDEFGRKFASTLSGGAKAVDEFIKDGERIRPALIGQTKAADAFEKALGNLTQAIASIKDAFGLAVAPAFTEFLTKLVDLIVQNREAFADFGKVVASVLTPFLQGLLLAFKGIGAIISLLTPVFNGLATAINKVFGSNLTGGQVFLALIVGIAAAFAPLIPLIALAAVTVTKFIEELSKLNFKPILTSASNIWRALADGFNTIVTTISDAFTAGGQAIVDTWNGVLDFFTGIWTSISDGAVAIWTTISDAFKAGLAFITTTFTTAFDGVKAVFNSFLAYIQGWVQSGIDFIQGLINKVKELINAITGLNNQQNSTAQGTQQAFAGGGAVHGPGTATSDSIPARLSNGEFVHRTKAVQHYGSRMMHAINNLTFPRVPGFSMGGLVDALSPLRSMPRFAEGGAVSAAGSKSSITLQMADGTQFAGLSAPADTAQAIVKYATVRAVRKGGTRPSWYGAGR
jgi:hypothetical protein